MVDIVTGVADYRADEPWDGKSVARIGNADTMILWADRPYHWHDNKADELFVVVQGRVEMHFRDSSGESKVWMETGDMMVIRTGEAHVAYPDGEARFLIVAAPPASEAA